MLLRVGFLFLIFSVLSVVYGHLGLLIAPIAITFALYSLGTLEGAFFLMLFGFFLDVLSASYLGSQSIALLAVWFVANYLVYYFSQADLFRSTLLIALLSIIYRLTWYFLGLVFLGEMRVLDWAALFYVPVIEGATGYFVIKALKRVPLFASQTEQAHRLQITLR